jgi:quinol-cytochrome oxidoreductase complex cytochrome b subunit
VWSPVRARYAVFFFFFLFVLFVFFLLRLQPEAQREEAREPMTPWEHERGEREA